MPVKASPHLLITMFYFSVFHNKHFTACTNICPSSYPCISKKDGNTTILPPYTSICTLLIWIQYLKFSFNANWNTQILSVHFGKWLFLCNANPY
jgi:hypothetical protein